MSKISVIGSGHVGTALGFAIVIRELCDELVMVNRTHEKAVGEAADLHHAATFVSHTMNVRAGHLADTAGSDIVLLTNSFPLTDLNKGRMSLAKDNIALFREWIPSLAAQSPDTVFVVISNPVDVLTYVTIQLSGLPANQVVGTGTVIDSVRFRSLLSDKLTIHPDDIRAYILGEHGATQFPALSVAATGGRLLDSDTGLETLFEQAREAGVDIVRKKGYTNYAIALATTLIIQSVIRDSHRTIPVSTLIDDYYGVSDVCLSVPAVIGATGVEKLLRPELSDPEIKRWQASARAVRSVLDELWK